MRSARTARRTRARRLRSSPRRSGSRSPPCRRSSTPRRATAAATLTSSRRSRTVWASTRRRWRRRSTNSTTAATQSSRPRSRRPPGWAAACARPRLRVARHLATPGAALPPARLDHLLEALEVALHAAVRGAERVAELLLDPLGHEVHLDHHARALVVELVERDDARVLLAVGVAPCDALVRQLLGDLGVPLVAAAAELGDPVEVRVVDLPDLLDTLHELRELLELGPLVIGRLHGDLDLDGLLDRGHAALLSAGLGFLHRVPPRCANLNLMTIE